MGGTATWLAGTLRENGDGAPPTPRVRLSPGCGGRGAAPAPAEEVPEAMSPHPYPHHRAGFLRVLPAPLPEPLGPAPGLAKPLPTPHLRGQAAGARGTPLPSPFSSIKPLGAASGATEPPLPRRPLLQSPGAGGGHPREGTAPFPGIGSHDTVPYPKRAPSCTAFSRVRCFTSVLGLDGSSLSRPGDPRSCPPPSSG